MGLSAFGILNNRGIAVVESGVSSVEVLESDAVEIMDLSSPFIWSVRMIVDSVSERMAFVGWLGVAGEDWLGESVVGVETDGTCYCS